MSSIRMTSGFRCSYFADRPEVEHQQPDGDERHAQQGDLQVRVHHQRRAEQLDVLALRVLDRRQL